MPDWRRAFPQVAPSMPTHVATYWGNEVSPDRADKAGTWKYALTLVIGLVEALSWTAPHQLEL